MIWALLSLVCGLLSFGIGLTVFLVVRKERSLYREIKETTAKITDRLEKLGLKEDFEAYKKSQDLI